MSGAARSGPARARPADGAPRRSVAGYTLWMFDFDNTLAPLEPAVDWAGSRRELQAWLAAQGVIEALFEEFPRGNLVLYEALRARLCAGGDAARAVLAAASSPAPGPPSPERGGGLRLQRRQRDSRRRLGDYRAPRTRRRGRGRARVRRASNYSGRSAPRAPRSRSSRRIHRVRLRPGCAPGNGPARRLDSQRGFGWPD